MSFASITYLTLQEGGLAGVSIVQGVPLLYRIFGTPVMAVVADRWSARNLSAGVVAALALAALGCVWFHLYWYVAIMTANAVLLSSFAIGYARLLPGILADGEIDRATGWISILTNTSRLLSAAAGAYLAYHIGTGVFVIVALLYAASAALFWRLPPAAGRAGPPGSAEPADRAHARGAMGSQIRLGLAYLCQRRERLLLLMLIMLSSLCLGVEEVVAMPIARDYLHIPAEWLGLYPAMGSVGGILGAVLLWSGLLTSGGRIVCKLGGLLLALAAAVGCLLLSASPVLGFGLKVVEGLIWMLFGVLGQTGLVLRADAALRGRLQAFLMACSASMLLAGKAAAGVLAGVTSGWAVYAGASALAGVLALLVMGLDVMRGRPRSRARPGRTRRVRGIDTSQENKE